MGPVNAHELDWTAIEDGEIRVRRKQLGEAAGGDRIGCSLYELPAGERSWPYHYHAANEEAIYVLSGTGTLRLGDETYALEPGDYASLPATPDGGHAVANDSDGPLRYLVVSTMNEPDVTVYPDSETFGVFVGSPPGGSGSRLLHGYYPIDADVDYWDEQTR
ncbi:cupin domain-containing protein [Halovivax limisalsi]|uniref:cupin domain-containing protein n=1 Tax=Halovivax limisalsi TaxID=1453760 RepID=UPI001FFCBF42|nr:cupin domain-containing protein [Halovivax limisalsi]